MITKRGDIMAFSDRLKIARERKNYNQKDLSMKIGRSQNVINGYERASQI